MRWAAEQDTKDTCEETSVCRRSLIARRDAEYQLKHADVAFVRITEKTDGIKEQLKTAQAIVKCLISQLDDWADQFERMRRARVELLEMKEVEKECEDDCGMAETLADQCGSSQMQEVPVINLEENGLT